MADLPALLAHADNLRQRGDLSGASDAYRLAHEAEPTRVYPLYWLAILAEESGELQQAYEYCQRALTQDSDQIGLLLLSARISKAMADDASALLAYVKVAALDPEVPSIDALLADQYCRLGRMREGIAAFDRALARTPDDAALQSNRLFVMNYSDVLAPQELFEAHRTWGIQHESVLKPQWPTHKIRESSERLRIGYVSPDLRDHAVALFIEPLLCEHDKARFEVHCFDSSPYPSDTTTIRLRQHVHMWHRVGELGDAALADLVRQTGIDILVDLAGHTKGNRLMMFARKPAPVQVTWLGYLNTTGLTAMDYRLTDSYLDPEGTTDALHTEQLVRLPTHACFSPWMQSPPVTRSPANHGAPLTFGSVNQWPKVSEATKDVWSEILVREPRARLFVIARGGQHQGVKAQIIESFVRRGANASQIQVFPFLPTNEFLQLLGKVDVALDPFPYGGGTTTMHCLWMGVPVVTLKGSTSFARNSVGMLSCLGLRDLVTESKSYYVSVALGLGRDRVRLESLRRELRPRLAASPLMDASAFTRNLEVAFRTMWASRHRHT